MVPKLVDHNTPGEKGHSFVEWPRNKPQHNLHDCAATGEGRVFVNLPGCQYTSPEGPVEPTTPSASKLKEKKNAFCFHYETRVRFFPQRSLEACGEGVAGSLDPTKSHSDPPGKLKRPFPPQQQCNHPDRIAGLFLSLQILKSSQSPCRTGLRHPYPSSLTLNVPCKISGPRCEAICILLIVDLGSQMELSGSQTFEIWMLFEVLPFEN